MLQRLAWILAALAFAHGLPANALGLGSIEVQSHLNQPFSAVISLYSLSEDDASSLQVQLAPAAEFQKANINRSDYLSSLRFTVNGGRVKVTSEQPVREPFLNLLVEAKASGNRVLRSYTILFDPPGISAPAAAAAPAAPAVAAAPAAPAAAKKPATNEFYQTAEEAARSKPAASAPAPVAAPAPAAAPASTVAAPASPAAAKPAPVAVAPPGPPPVPATTPSATAPAASPTQAPAVATPKPTPPAAAPAPNKSGPAAATSYGPVKAGQTFWNVANLMRPSNSVSLDQTMLAIFEANPAAFVGGFNGLVVGSTLRIPSEEQMRSVPAETAHNRVLELRNASTAQSASVAAVPEKAPAINSAADARKPAAPPAAPPAPVVSKPVVEPKPAVVAKPAPEPASKAAAPAPAKPAAIDPPVPVPAFAPAKPAPAAEPASVEPAAAAPVAATPPPASLDQQAAMPPPAEASGPEDAATSAEGPGFDIEEPIDATAESPIKPFIPALIVGAVVFAIVLLLMSLRRRRHVETFRRDSIQDYIRPEPALDAASPKVSSPASAPLIASTPVATPAPAIKPGSRNEPSLLASATPAPAATDSAAIRPSRTAPVFSPPVAEPSPIVEQPPVAPAARVEPAAGPVFETLLPPDPVEEPVVSPPPVALPEFDLAEPPTAAPEPQSKQSLNSDDPLRQADFHLSYGLYDEAVRCLMTALMRNPGRQDLAIKLAETYFAAGRPADFESLADGLKDRVSATEWEALAEMGAQLCPGSALFAAPAAQTAPAPAPAARSEPDLLAVPKPEAVVVPEPAPSPLIETPVAATKPVDIRPESRTADLRFEVRPDLRAEPRAEARTESAAEPRFKALLDLLGDAPAKPAAPAATPARPEPPLEVRTAPRFDLSAAPPAAADVAPPEPEVRADKLRREPRFESVETRTAPRIDARAEPSLPSRVEPTASVPAAPTPVQAAPSAQEPLAARTADTDRVEFRLEPSPEPAGARREPRAAEVASLPFNLSPPPSGRREPMMGALPPAGPEESAVKLDLARAYIDMGDLKTARTLLLEVAEQGNPAQQTDARGLLSSLPN